MKEPSARYEIRIRGTLSERLLGAFPGLTVKVRDGMTVLVGRLPDQAALYGVLERLEALGLELLAVSSRGGKSSGSDDDHSSAQPRG